MLILHFHAFHFDAPRVGGFVQCGLHRVRDVLAVGEDFGQVFHAQHVAQRRGGQQARRETTGRR